LKINVKIN